MAIKAFVYTGAERRTMPPQWVYVINWWYGFHSGADKHEGKGSLGWVYDWTPTPPILTVRYLSGRGALS